MSTSAEFRLKIREGFCENDWACWRVKRMRVGSYDGALLIRVDPPLVGGECGSYGPDTEFLLISPHFEGDSLFPFSDWPLEVRVFAMKIESPDQLEKLAPSEVINIGFGTIYGLGPENKWPREDVGYPATRDATKHTGI